MFIKTPLEADNILRSYGSDDYELDENLNSFEDQIIRLLISRAQWLELSKTWVPPKYCIQDPELWRAEYKAFVDYGNAVEIDDWALLCSTFFDQHGTKFSIRLGFSGPDQIKHFINVYLYEFSLDGTCQAKKVIDGVLGLDIYDFITKTGHINPRIAKKLNSIGSVTWSDSTESRVQRKLNSLLQSRVFETVASRMPNVTLKQLDKFDDYLYKGDPGSLGDYDLSISRADGSTITTRIDLKLLLDLSAISTQKAHDAELLIATDMFNSGSVCYYAKTPKCNVNLRDVPEFEEFRKELHKALYTDPPKYIKIHKIFTDTGKVDFTYFR